MVLLQEDEISNAGSLSQRVGFTKEFPEDEIQQAWKEGRRVVLIDYLDEQWVLVSEKAASSTTVGQNVVFTTEPLPGELLQNDIWNKEKRLTCLSFQPKVGWVMIGENKAGLGQSYAAGSDWPEAKIADRISKGMTVAGIAWNTTDEAWALVFDGAAKNQTITTTIHLKSGFDEDLMRTLAVTRYGKRF